MIIGYARVSTQEQNLQMQLDALKEHGCEKVYSEKASGGNTSRPELDKMLELLRRGDTVVIWKLDRLGRSLKHLIDLVSAFDSQGVGLVSLKENIDTTTATGKLVFNIIRAHMQDFVEDRPRHRAETMSRHFIFADFHPSQGAEDRVIAHRALSRLGAWEKKPSLSG